MIAYFDASALVKLLIAEPGSDTTVRTWAAADGRLVATVGRAEVASAMARALRDGRLSVDDVTRLRARFGRAWAALARLNVDDRLAGHAADLALRHGLRGFDAVHLAAAVEGADTLVAADRALLVAAAREGIATVDVAA